MINLAPLVNAWFNAIKAAEKDKAPFTETGEICEHFFSGSVGFMWDKKFRSKYFSGMPAPTFQVTLAKASELVQIVGPTLMWGNPARLASGYEKLEIPPEMYAFMSGVTPDDPETYQAFMQQYVQETQEAVTKQHVTNALMQAYLNYSPREQPGGGLKVDSQMSIIEALVKGRGCIRVDAYSPADDQGTLTGGFYMSVDDLFIDPNCTRANLSNAQWIAIRHVEPHDVVEKKFGWPPGSLKSKASLTSKQAAAGKHKNVVDNTFHRNSETNDLCVWFEIFSKAGVGTRLKGNPLPQWHDAFEEAVGDFAYLAIMKGVNQPLNLRQEFVDTADMEQVGAALDWPIPYYKDGRWPVAVLDFWLNPRSAWPLAPLAMGLGELILMNVVFSSLADSIYRDGLVKAAIRQELADDAVAKLTSLNHEVLSLNPAIAQNINEMVSYLQRPKTDTSGFQLLEYASQMFDKRVGLMELMYGFSSKVSRTAQDAKIKGEAVSVRPEFMATRVTEWQTEIANLERIAAGYSVHGDTLVPFFGSTAASMWTQLITQADPVVYMREMRSRIEADSIRKPNRAKDNENLTQTSGYMLPMLQWYAGTTGNTEPLNNFLKSMGKAIDHDVDGWMMPTIQPPQPSEEEVAQQQEMAALEKADKQTKISGREMKNTQLAHQMMEEGQGIPTDMLSLAQPAPQPPQ